MLGSSLDRPSKLFAEWETACPAEVEDFRRPARESCERSTESTASLLARAEAEICASKDAAQLMCLAVLRTTLPSFCSLRTGTSQSLKILMPSLASARVDGCRLTLNRFGLALTLQLPRFPDARAQGAMRVPKEVSPERRGGAEFVFSHDVPRLEVRPALHEHSPGVLRNAGPGQVDFSSCKEEVN